MLSQSGTKSSETNQAITIERDYMINKQIYKGKVYNLFLAIKKGDSSKYYLIKIKRTTNKEQNNEILFMNKLKDINCTPRLISAGEEKIKGVLYEYQILDRQGPSLKLIYNYHLKNIPLPVLCVLGIQTLTCLEKLHSQWIVHRNLRPKKLITSQNGTEILLTDFSSATIYKRNGVGIQNETLKSQNKSFLNKYSSLNAHLGQTPCPRDDLESLIYILLYYLNRAPILNQADPNQNARFKKLEIAKLTLIPEKEFKGAPLEFLQFYYMVRSSNISDYPCDYDKYKQLFKKCLMTHGLSEKDVQFQWLNKSNLFIQASNKVTSSSIAEQDPDEEDDGEDRAMLEPASDVDLKIQQLRPLNTKTITQLNTVRKMSKRFSKISQNFLSVPKI